MGGWRARSDGDGRFREESNNRADEVRRRGERRTCDLQLYHLPASLEMLRVDISVAAESLADPMAHARARGLEATPGRGFQKCRAPDGARATKSSAVIADDERLPQEKIGLGGEKKIVVRDRADCQRK